MKGMHLPDNIKKVIDEFVNNLESVYGDGLVSAVLYGSAASGEYAFKHSNVNMMIVLKDASLDNLGKISHFINKRKFMIINPLFFTEDYIKRSTDTFPIEFMDMKENHLVLKGKDVLKDINIDTAHLRFQCEQELKLKIINIKRYYLRTGDKAMLEGFLFKSLSSSIHILRNLIRLKGKIPPYTKEEVLDQAAQEFGIDIVPLRKILDAKNKNLKLDRSGIGDLYSSLIKTLEAASDKVDHL